MKKRTLSVPWKATWTSLADVTLLVVETWVRAAGRRPLLAMTSRAGAGVVLAGCDRDRQEWRRHTCPSNRPLRPPPSASAAVCSVVCAAGSWLSESSGENATFSSVLSHHNLLSLCLSPELKPYSGGTQLWSLLKLKYGKSLFYNKFNDGKGCYFIFVHEGIKHYRLIVLFHFFISYNVGVL